MDTPTCWVCSQLIASPTLVWFERSVFVHIACRDTMIRQLTVDGELDRREREAHSRAGRRGGRA
jgi:hypothetical protein